MAVDAELNADQTQVVDGLVGAIKTIAADPNYNLLANIFNENLHLRAKNAELISTNRNVFEQFYEFRRDLEDAQSRLQAAKDAIETELAGKVRELTTMTEARDQLHGDLAGKVQELTTMTGAHDQLDGELTTTKAELAETTSTKEKLETDLAEANSALDELRTRKASLEEELSQVNARLEEQKRLSDVAAQENAALQVSLSQREAELAETKSNLETNDAHLKEVTRERDNLKESLCQTQQELTAKVTRLAELDSYRIVLRTEPEDAYVAILDTIWTQLFNLVEEHFSQDLEDKVMNDLSCWDNLRNSKALEGPRKIPLPQSNSPVAKAMRIASVLAVLSRTLHKYIFRPFYLVDDDTEITRLLHAVESDNPSREENIRSTLLATLPESQRNSAKGRVQRVVRDVSWVVQHLLGALQYDAFCSGLANACAVACTEWQKIQMAKTKIEPYFGPPYDEFDWQALPLPEFEGRKGSPQTRSAVGSVRGSSPAPTAKDDAKEGGAAGDGAGSTAAELDGTAAAAGDSATEVDNTPGEGAPVTENTDAAEVGASEDAAAAASAAAAGADTAIDDDGDNAFDHDDEDSDSDDGVEMNPHDILLVVWPCMAIVENGDEEPITQGLVVTNKQATLAFKELNAARNGGMTRPGGKRARSMSIPSLPHPSIAGSPQSSKSFLVAGGGEEA